MNEPGGVGAHVRRRLYLMRTVVVRLCRKLGDNADHPTYVFTQPRGRLLDAGGVEGASPE